MVLYTRSEVRALRLSPSYELPGYRSGKSLVTGQRPGAPGAMQTRPRCPEKHCAQSNRTCRCRYIPKSKTNRATALPWLSSTESCAETSVAAVTTMKLARAHIKNCPFVNGSLSNFRAVSRQLLPRVFCWALGAGIKTYPTNAETGWLLTSSQGEHRPGTCPSP